jgi:very-short-patch-repair endonuclease
MAAVIACGGESTRMAGVREIQGDESLARWEEDGSQAVLHRWGAALSHRGAASLWGLLPVAGGTVDVSVPGGGGRRKRRGIRLHRCATLSPASVTLRRGIPVTTPTRTISDLRRAASRRARQNGRVSPKDLRRAIQQANVLGLPIGPEADPDRTRSELERDFLRLCRRHRLPAPEVNVRVGRHLVDFLWREHRLVVETDGYRYHRGRAAFEGDRDRDLDLRAMGYEVVRLSFRQVTGDPRRVALLLSRLMMADSSR